MTERLPFDPSRMRTGKRADAGGQHPPASGNSASNPPALSVSQLAAKIDSALKTNIRGRVVVAGEISSLSQRTHWYFSLKDSNAVVGAVVFASVARKISYQPKHGDSVIATGRLEFYAPSGRVSFIVEQISLAGAGELEQRYRELCDELRELGWFDPLSKRLLPQFPRRIAVITSNAGAALQDVISTMSKRCPAVDLLVVDARMQGDSAAPQIVNAIRALDQHQAELGIDAIILTRGGGSLEDLWAFNERSVAEAIHACSLPIVAAIGHETDTTIAELVADERCATPTQAAMKLTPDRDALAEQLASLVQRLRASVLHSIRYRRQTLDGLAGSAALSSPQRLLQIQYDRLNSAEQTIAHLVRARLARARRSVDTAALRLARHQPAALHARRAEHLDGLERQLPRILRSKHARIRDRLDAIERELNAIGPLQVLSRGYSVTQTADGRIVRKAVELAADDLIITRTADGSVRSRVVDKSKQPPKKRVQRGADAHGDGKPQMDLF